MFARACFRLKHPVADRLRCNFGQRVLPAVAVWQRRQVCQPAGGKAAAFRINLCASGGVVVAKERFGQWDTGASVMALKGRVRLESGSLERS